MINARLSIIIISLIALPAVTAIGCVRTPKSALDGRIHAPRTENYPIDIYMTKKPNRPYTEIRYIRREVGKNPDGLVEWMRNIARASGGDAVIKLESSQWSKDGLFSGEGGEMFNGIVIVYDDIKGVGDEHPKAINQETAPQNQK